MAQYRHPPLIHMNERMLPLRGRRRLITGGTRDFSLRSQFLELFDEPVEKRRWQQPVIDTRFIPPDGVEVEARPRENIYLVQDYPGSFAVEPQVLFDTMRDFNGGTGVVRRQMRDRHDCDLLATVRFGSGHFDGEDDCARPVLSPLNQALLLFLLPEIRSTK